MLNLTYNIIVGLFYCCWDFVEKNLLYTIPDDIKRSYEKLKVPLLIIGPLASGGFRPLAISDGFLDFNNISRDELYNYYGDRINDGLYEKVHPDEREKLRAISIDFLDKKSEYGVSHYLQHHNPAHSRFIFLK